MPTTIPPPPRYRDDVTPDAGAQWPSAPARPMADPASGLLAAIRAHRWLAGAPVIALTGLALAAGLVRAPAYTAETRLSVGRIDVATQAIPGVVAGTVSLANSYSRLITATPVVEPIAAQLGVPPGEIAASLASSQIPESNLFLIEATGGDQDAAIELANVAATTLTAYISEVNRATTASTDLLADFERAALATERARARLAVVETRQAVAPSQAGQRTVEAAAASLEAARLNQQTLSGLYGASRQGLASSNELLVVNPATSAISDRSSVLQRLAFTGLMAGLLLGAALAMLADRRSRHRA